MEFLEVSLYMKKTLKFNFDRNIGTVIYFVEGGNTEFSLLQIIFGKILHYDFVEKKRHRQAKFIDNNCKRNQVYVINTSESNISDISDKKFLDEVCEYLINEYGLDLDNAAKFYLFDRDKGSNTNQELIEYYLRVLTEPYGDDTEFEKGGLLLLSFPSIEAFVLSNFINNIHKSEYKYGHELKTFMGKEENQKTIQFNKISDETLIFATNEFLRYVESIDEELNLDAISELNKTIYKSEEENSGLTGKYRVVSELLLSLLYLGVMEIFSRINSDFQGLSTSEIQKGLIKY